MAINFDSVTTGQQVGGTTLTIAHTNTGSGITLVAWFSSDKVANTDDVTATYNGVSMSKISSQLVFSSISVTAVFVLYIGTGDGLSHNVVFTSASTPDRMTGGVISLGGTNSIQNGGSISTFGTSNTTTATVTTISNGSWIVGGFEYNDTIENLSQTVSGSTVQEWKFDESTGGRSSTGGYAPTVTAGSNPIGWTSASSVSWAGSAVEIISGVSSISTSDLTSVTDAPVLKLINNINKSDTTVVTESVNIKVGNTTTSDELALLTTSNYKWMTSTLLTAQQSYNIQSYFKCFILDDTVQPNAIINNGSQLPLARGSSVTAPDGSVLAAGYDGSLPSHIVFYKASNLHASAGIWDSTFTLYTGTDADNNQNNVSINVSDWINGSYHIDVFFFSNFVNSSTNLNISHYYSDDGGVTWNNQTINPTSMPGSNYFGATPFNLSLSAFKPRVVNGLVQYGCCFIKPSGATSDTNYQIYDIWYINGNSSGFNSFAKWTRNIFSNDWTIHSLSTFYFNGRDYIVFSGFRNFIDNPNPTFYNYSIWLTSIISEQNSSTTDIWAKARLLFSSNSSTAVNQNAFTFPTATITNGVINVLFRASVVTSVSQSAQGSTSQLVTTTINYMLMNSTDAKNFTYPSIVVFSDGTVFNDTNQNQTYNSYTNQGQYYYILGSGKLWEFIQNNTLADVTNYVIQYNIQDTAGQASSISIQIANQNNIWYPNGTNSGASAISKNKKILIQQGYFNANGVPETVPRSTYYIDDIQANVTSNSNDFTLTGRDFYKKFALTITKYLYSYNGPFMYTDIFDGSTLSNWTQNSGGTWIEAGNTMTQALNGLVAANTPINDSNITLSGIPTASYASLMSLNFFAPIAGTLFFYGFYISDTDWLRLEISGDGMGNHSWAVNGLIGTTLSNYDSGTISLSNTDTYGLIIRRYDYYKFNFIVSRVGDGNAIDQYTTGTGTIFLCANSTPGEYDLTATIPLQLASQTWSVGFGFNGGTSATTNVPIFSFFKYMQYDDSNNVSDLVNFLCRLSGVNNLNIQDIYTEYFINTSEYTGTFTTPNNTMLISASQEVINNNSSLQISNGEIRFVAQLTPSNSASPYGFSLVFRSTSSGEYYWHIYATATGGYIASRFERLYMSTVYPFSMNSSDASNVSSALNNIYFDITQKHSYKVIMVDGWMIAYIDDVLINIWNDNNITSPYLTTGFWGWKTDSNSSLKVYSMASTSFWKQVSNFALNPGDDVFDAITTSLLQTVRSWIFSNIMSMAKVLFLNSADSSTYTYQNQIYTQGVDDSDKEYVSQITVYGSGVSAVAQNTMLMAGVPVREEVIVDYTILTEEDAQNRANYELTNANQYQNQYNPKQTMNVGSELFDVVTVVNTGNNSSGVSAPTRVYAQVFTTGSSSNSNEFSVEIDSGNL